MTKTAVALAEAPEPEEPKKKRDPIAVAVVVVGVLTLVSWVVFLLGGFVHLDEATTRLVSDLQLAMALLSVVAAGLTRRRVYLVIAAVAAVAHVGSWLAIGKIYWGIPDALYLALIAVFYLSVPVAGVSVLIAGVKRMRAGR